MQPPFVQVGRVGIAAEGGVEQPAEMNGRIALDPGRERADPLQDRFCPLPLFGQVVHDCASPLGVDDLDLVVDVEEDCSGMC
jgi:hypothetical protein